MPSIVLGYDGLSPRAETENLFTSDCITIPFFIIDLCKICHPTSIVKVPLNDFMLAGKSFIISTVLSGMNL